MLQFRKAILLVCLMGVGASTWAAASVVPKWSVSELTDFADVIVTGRVTGITAGRDPAVNTIYTYVALEVDEVLKGPVSAGPLTIKQMGGVVGDTGLRVFDQPTFVAGERVLLYLEARPRDGSLYTSALWQGKWTIEENGGERIAVRIEPIGHRSAYPIDRQTMASVRTRSVGVNSATAPQVNTAPVEATAAVAQPYVFLGPYRYSFSPAVDLQAGGQSGLAGGGVAEVQGAIAKWNAVGSSFQYTFGSANGPARCSSQELFNNRVTISFNDPCGEVSNFGGTLAVGGSYYVASSTTTINGVAFARATEGFIVNNDSSTALEYLRQSGCFADTQLHELGHVLGLDHTSDSAAVMFPSIPASCSSGSRNLAADDIAGLLFIYPSSGGALTPPSSAPTGLQVTVNGTASITVSFTAVNALVAEQPSAASAYRLDFRQSIGGPIVASLTTATTVTDIPVPPGTLGTFNVTATAINAAGAGPSSAPLQFTIGGPGPCGGPPASPVVSGGVVAGTATVTWPQVAGVTSYILSAGTAPGLSNLYPTSNIGLNNVASASGLPPGFTAWVRIIAVNACGQSAPTDFFVQ